METTSILIQTLSVPCACRCRHCLLRWDGRTVGADWARSVAFARRFQAEVPATFAFGYSMEHPRLREALRDLRALGSPQAEYLHCDGLRLRDAAGCSALAALLREEGVREVHFTFYGLREAHDRFAGRLGDFDFLLRLMCAARENGLTVSAGIALTRENAPEVDALLELLRPLSSSIFLFVPHREGRGRGLEPIRFSLEEISCLSPAALGLLNREVFKPESEWLAQGFQEETRRMLLLSLREDSIGRYEKLRPAALIAELEALDEAYYAAFPPLPELAERYGRPDGKCFYRQRDLFARYRSLYAAEHPVSVYDVTDERQSGSRRF